MGTIKFTTSLVLTGLFVVAIIGFALSFASNNDVAVSLAEDEDFTQTKSNTIGNLSAFKDSAESSNDAFSSTQAKSGDEVSSSGGQFKGGIDDVIKITTSSLGLGYEKIFGKDEGFGIFLTTLLGMITLVIGLYAYKTWFGRNPD